MSVFVLQHIHSLDEEREDIKLIGVYSSQEEAEKAITRMRLQPGFCDTPEGFAISKIILNKDYWEEGYVMTEGDNDADKE
jgi:hypothetical protein